MARERTSPRLLGGRRAAAGSRGGRGEPALKIVFLGTPEFAAPSLARLAAEPDFRVTLAVTQPDRAVGRHATPVSPAVAVLARERGIPVFQPEKLRGSAGALDRLRAASPDAIVVVAYGKILPREVLEVPRLGCVNVHGSLLPRHRGASPVQAAILAGDAVTGVSTMKMTEGLDEGPVYLEREIPIAPDDTAGTLSRRLADAGADLLVETLRGIAAGTLAARPQAGEPSYCRTIRRSDGEVDWNLPADAIVRKLHAYTPWPGIFTTLSGERIKILDAREGGRGAGEPGGASAEGDALRIACGGGTTILAARLQREGRSPVTGAELLRGLRAGEVRFGGA